MEIAKLQNLKLLNEVILRIAAQEDRPDAILTAEQLRVAVSILCGSDAADQIARYTPRDVREMRKQIEAERGHDWFAVARDIFDI